MAVQGLCSVPQADARNLAAASYIPVLENLDSTIAKLDVLLRYVWDVLVSLVWVRAD